MGQNYQSKSSEAMRNGSKHFENLLFSKRAPRAKGQVSRHPGHPH